MGIYLNPANDSFMESLRSEIYVDKSGIIRYTNRVLGTRQKNICVSRPRRFGKSMTAEMLAAYYSCGCDSRQLFRELDIVSTADFAEHLNRYNVLFINMQDFLGRAGNVENMISYLQSAVLKELQVLYGDTVNENGAYLGEALEHIYQNTKKGFVFIIDEWDCIFREKKIDMESHTLYLDFLRNLLKDKSYVKLAYMTGILPIKKYGTHSALNMFDEYSMMNPDMLAEFVGFTEIEVKELCECYHMDFQEMQRWYDGYCFEKQHIYNPKSVVDSLRRKKWSSYWTQTETYEALKVYIEMNFDGLKDAIVLMLGGERCQINPRTFQNDMTTFHGKDDVLTLLIHLGYLAFDETKSEVFIPNHEIEMEFINAIDGAGWTEVIHAVSDSEALLKATWRQDSKYVAQEVDKVHMDNTSVLTYNNENALSCVISLAYYSARNYYHIMREMQAGKGFADMIFIPRENCSDKPALVIELKWDKSASGAIEQIKSKKYIRALDNYSGEILLVGINYDKESKKHQCVIELY